MWQSNEYNRRIDNEIPRKEAPARRRLMYKIYNSSPGLFLLPFAK